MAIKPIQRFGKFTPTGVDRSGEIRMRALAGLGEKVFDITRDVYKTKREEEAVGEAIEAAEKARKVDPATGEVTYEDVEKRSALKFGASVYNQTLIQAMSSQRDSDSRIRIAELAETYKDDPTGFQNEAQAYKKGLLEASPDEMRISIDADLSERIFAQQQKINTAHNTKVKSDSIAKHTSNIEQGATEALRHARLGDETALNSEIASVHKSMDARALIDESFDAEYAKNKLALAVNRQKESAKLDKLFDEDPNKARAYLDDLRGNIPKGEDPDSWDTFTASEQAELNRRASNKKAQETVNTQADKEFVDGVVASISMGKDVDAKDLDKAYEIAKGTDAEKNLKDAVEVSNFVKQDYTTRNGIKKQAEEAGIGGAELLEKLNVAEANMARALDNDPMGTAFSQGAGGIEKSEFNVLQPTPEALAERKNQAKLASLHYYGKENVPFSILTKAEKDTLVAGFVEMTPMEQEALASVYGADSAIWGLFSDDDEGVYAQGATHPNKSVRLGIFDGIQALEEGTIRFLPTDKDTSKDTFYDYIGQDTVPDEDAKDLLEASMAYYASIVPQGSAYDSDAFENAVRAVVGNVGVVRGEKTLIGGNITEDQLELYFDEMTVDELRTLLPNKTDAQLANDLDLITGEARVKQVAGNKYIIDLGGYTVYEEDGITPYEFTVNEESLLSALVTGGLSREEAIAKADAYRVDTAKSRYGRVSPFAPSIGF
jgi:hypothetical protein